MGPVPWEYIIAQGNCLEEPHVPRELGPICRGEPFFELILLGQPGFQNLSHLPQGIMF